jgi:predicted HAD superfamily Cof-like phosphohydrolase
MNYFSQVKKWNDDRDNTTFNRRLEARMLLEEWFEFLGYDAHDCKALSETITQQYYNQEKADNMRKVDSCDALGDLIFIAMGGMGKLTSKGDEIFQTIQGANNQKSKTKNTEGKITKPSGFIPPEFIISEILKEEENGH